MAITKDSPITVTVSGACIIGGGLFAGVLGAYLFLFNEQKDDIAAIRATGEATNAAVTALGSATHDDTAGLAGADIDIRKELADLTLQLKTTGDELNASMKELSAAVSTLNDSIKTVDAKLDASIQRQQSFETYVVTRLGLDKAALDGFPESWGASQAAVLDSLKQMDDPLSAWAFFVKGGK